MENLVITDKNQQPSLNHAQEFLGGYVERMEMPNGDVLLMDEEGRLKNLPLNAEIFVTYGVGILGKVIIIKESARTYNEHGWG